MILSAFTIFHVVLSLLAIGAGFVVIYGLLTNRLLERWTTIFLATTAATSVTGFMFPFHGFTPAYGLGAISLIVLGIAAMARYRYLPAGRWRRIWVFTTVSSLYLNFFVLIVQLFRKVPALNALAPTGSEAPFQIAQLVAIAAFIAISVRAAMKFRGETLRAASQTAS